MERFLVQVEKLKSVAPNVGSFVDGNGNFVVRFSLSTDFLEPVQAKNWGVNKKKPIVIQLKLPEEWTASSTPPSVLVFQSSDKDLNKLTLSDYDTEFGVLQWFLETRLTSVLRKNWDLRPESVLKNRPVWQPREEDVNALTVMGFDKNAVIEALQMHKSLDNAIQYLLEASLHKEAVQRSLSLAQLDSQDQFQELSYESKNTKKRESPREAEIVDEDKKKELIAMGFDESTVIDALKAAGNNVEEALDRILNPNSYLDDKDTSAPRLKRAKTEAIQDSDKTSITDPKLAKLLSMGFDKQMAVCALEAFGGDLEMATAELLAAQQPAPPQAPKSESSKRNNSASSLQRTRSLEELTTLEDHENLWLEEDGFLSKLYLYISDRFITCPSHCLICDKKLHIDVIRLPVCSNQSCVRLYESTSCGGSIISDIHNQPEVVDFLINLLCACATSRGYRRGLNHDNIGLEVKRTGFSFYAFPPPNQVTSKFEPFPYNLGFDKNGNQDLDLLVATLDTIPSVKVMQQCSTDEQLKAMLDEINPLAFPLLRWILKSNRSHLELIPKEKQIKRMGTPLQFQVISSFPEHEKKFREWVQLAKAEGCHNRQTGSYYAFHGSPIYNFHSIVRTGLRSGFVPGIYHANSAGVSFGYMTNRSESTMGWANSLHKTSSKMCCISLIEVADMRHNSKLITGGVCDNLHGVNVAMDNSLVITRFLFFYPDGPTSGDDTPWGFIGEDGKPDNRGPLLASRIAFDNFRFRNDEEDDVSQEIKEESKEL